MTQVGIDIKWTADPRPIRERLPNIKDEDNPIVWCKRCQRHHKHWTFTRYDFDKIVAENARKLADHIDAEIEKMVYGNET